MPEFKVKLTCPVELTATTEITVIAPSEDEAGDLAIERLKELDAEHQKALTIYKKTHTNYPTPLYFWTVDQDDVDGAIEEDEIGYDEIEEVDS